MKGAPELPRLLLVGGPDVDLRLELMERLRERFHCAAIGSDPRLENRFRDAGFDYRVYPSSRGFDPEADARAAEVLHGAFRELRPRVVHCFDTKPAVFGRLAASLAGVPVVVGTLPGLGALYTYGAPGILSRRRFFQALHALCCRLSSATIFQNPDDLEQMVGEGVAPAERCVLIEGSGVAAERFAVATSAARQQARARLGLREGQSLVLMVARLIRAKGVKLLAAAAHQLRLDRSPCRVMLAGPAEPEALDGLSQLEIEELRPAVEWLGPRQDVPELLHAADVFVFPSHYREGIPRVLVEAALAGVPIVATDMPGCREVVEDGETGLRIPPRCAQSLRDAILRLLQAPDWAADLAKEARRRALRRFELGAIAAQHRELYLDLLEQAGQPA